MRAIRTCTRLRCRHTRRVARTQPPDVVTPGVVATREKAEHAPWSCCISHPPVPILIYCYLDYHHPHPPGHLLDIPLLVHRVYCILC